VDFNSRHKNNIKKLFRLMTIRKTINYGSTENINVLWTLFRVCTYDCHWPLNYYGEHCCQALTSRECNYSFMTRNLLHSSTMRDWMCFRPLVAQYTAQHFIDTSQAAAVRPLIWAPTIMSARARTHATVSKSSLGCRPKSAPSASYPQQPVKELS
jgi:hypothetical protein